MGTKTIHALTYQHPPVFVESGSPSPSPPVSRTPSPGGAALFRRRSDRLSLPDPHITHAELDRSFASAFSKPYVHPGGGGSGSGLYHPPHTYAHTHGSSPLARGPSGRRQPPQQRWASEAVEDGEFQLATREMRRRSLSAEQQAGDIRRRSMERRAAGLAWESCSSESEHEEDEDEQEALTGSSHGYYHPPSMSSSRPASRSHTAIPSHLYLSSSSLARTSSTGSNWRPRSYHLPPAHTPLDEAEEEYAYKAVHEPVLSSSLTDSFGSLPSPVLHTPPSPSPPAHAGKRSKPLVPLGTLEPLQPPRRPSALQRSWSESSAVPSLVTDPFSAAGSDGIGYVPSRHRSRANDHLPSRKDDEWTPSCTDSVKRSFRTFSLQFRFGVFRARKRVERKLQ